MENYNNNDNEKNQNERNINKDVEEITNIENINNENKNEECQLLKKDINKEENNNKKSKRKEIIFHIIAIICISMFCAAISPKTLQNDTFYTVTIGEYIYNNGISDLTKDLYSWHELPYTYPHWLYDLGM